MCNADHQNADRSKRAKAIPSMKKHAAQESWARYAYGMHARARALMRVWRPAQCMSGPEEAIESGQAITKGWRIFMAIIMISWR